MLPPGGDFRDWHRQVSPEIDRHAPAVTPAWLYFIQNSENGPPPGKSDLARPSADGARIARWEMPQSS
jgi:hypothetical protein